MKIGDYMIFIVTILLVFLTCALYIDFDFSHNLWLTCTSLMYG